jgi:hypothetical protein
VTDAAATSLFVLAHMWDGGWGIVWGLGVVAFWIAVIGVIVVLLRAAAGEARGS